MPRLRSLLPILLWIAAPAVAAPTVLTTAAQVRALTAVEAGRAIPVQLHGVYMGEADPPGIAFVMQDDTEGIYVQGPASVVAGLSRGDYLEVDGITTPGGFAPYIVAREIHRLGRRPIPEPTRVPLDDLNSGQMDAKWIEISGIVRSVAPTAASDTAPPPPGTRYVAPARDAAPAADPKVKLKLASGSAQVIVEMHGRLRPEDYVDAEVRLRGLCFNLHNGNRQFVRPFVQVPRGLSLVVEQPPPAHPFSSPPRPVASLLQFQDLKRKHGHRVHVRGVVVHSQPGVALWVRDGDRSVRVDTTQTDPLRPGDVVDVLGFPAMGDYSPILEDAMFRRSASGPPPAPRVLSDVSSALRDDADLVELQGRLLELRRLPEDVELIVQWHHVPVRARLYLPDGVAAPGGWLPGSVVRVVGVCSVIPGQARPLGGLWEPRSFQLLLRSPADLAVLKSPPWWNAERIVWVLSSFLALALVAVAGVMLASRRRLREQERRREMAEAEFGAILNERNRVAREIHDTLSQNLGAISVQLELARTHAAEIGEAARQHLGAAHKLARAALADARESIWDMRSQVLEQCDLGEALDRILQRMCDGTALAAQMEVEGARRRLPPIVENNLLRIGQEAITNACKHARASRINVTLAFSGRTVRLTVEDDGVGFVPASAPNPERRSFGLVGIRERADLLGGTCVLTSAPGEGTRVTVTVPV